MVERKTVRAHRRRIQLADPVGAPHLRLEVQPIERADVVVVRQDRVNILLGRLSSGGVQPSDERQLEAQATCRRSEKGFSRNRLPLADTGCPPFQSNPRAWLDSA